MTEKFNFEQALEALKGGKPLTGQDSVLLPLSKQLAEAALEAEADTHLAQEISPNRKNGKSDMLKLAQHLMQMYSPTSTITS